MELMTEDMTEEQKKNWAFALEISRATRGDPQSPYTGKYICVLHQQVVAIADTLEGAEAQLNALETDSHEGVWIEASVDYERTYMIWEF